MIFNFFLLLSRKWNQDDLIGRSICNNADCYFSVSEERSRADLTSLISPASVVSSRPSILRGFRREPDPPLSAPLVNTPRSLQNISSLTPSTDLLPATSTSIAVQHVPDASSPATDSQVSVTTHQDSVAHISISQVSARFIFQARL